jgi:hypothetical protein
MIEEFRDSRLTVWRATLSEAGRGGIGGFLKHLFILLDSGEEFEDGHGDTNSTDYDAEYFYQQVFLGICHAYFQIFYVLFNFIAQVVYFVTNFIAKIIILATNKRF